MPLMGKKMSQGVSQTTGNLNWGALLFVGLGAVLLIVAWQGTQGKLWGAITGKSSGTTNTPTGSNNPPSMTITQAAQGIVNALGFGNKQYATTAAQDAINAGVDPTLFLKQINLESGFNPKALSPAGAEGIAQFLPSTAAGLNVNPWDPNQSLQGASNLMHSYFTEFGSYQKALAAYNAGPTAVTQAEAKCLDPRGWLYCLDPQTQNYVHTITGT